MERDLSKFNKQHLLIIDKVLSLKAIKYNNSFTKHDLQDIVSDCKFKLLNYAPEFESDKHATNWANLFCNRYLINSIRDFCTKNKKITFTPLTENNEEQNIAQKWFSNNNYNLRLSALSRELDKSSLEVRQMCKNYLLPKNKLSSMFKLSRRQIRNKVNGVINVVKSTT